MLFTLTATDTVSTERPHPDPSIGINYNGRFLQEYLGFTFVPTDVSQTLEFKHQRAYNQPKSMSSYVVLQWPLLSTYVPLCAWLSARLSETTPTWKPGLRCSQSFSSPWTFDLRPSTYMSCFPTDPRRLSPACSRSPDTVHSCLWTHLEEEKPPCSSFTSAPGWPNMNDLGPRCPGFCWLASSQHFSPSLHLPWRALPPWGHLLTSHSFPWTWTWG